MTEKTTGPIPEDENAEGLSKEQQLYEFQVRP